MPKILVVDDEQNIRKLYREELEDAGYTVSVAENASEARREIHSGAPDLVVLDIKLEQDNGLELLREFKQQQPGLTVILNSGYSAYKDDFSSWLADAYLVKSSDTTELLGKVEELLTAKPVG